MSKAPAPRPCESCPYRRDVPAGLWAAHEYEKLPDYDRITPYQPLAMFYCHQQDGRLCAGWLACHGVSGPGGLLSVRVSTFTPEEIAAINGYETDVEVFGSGTEAALHGLSGVVHPDERAVGMIEKLEQQRERRGL
jgi:Family of unknown function (DUF6283)